MPAGPSPALAAAQQEGRGGPVLRPVLPAVPSLRLVQLAELGSVVTARFPLNCQPQKRARGCSLTVCERGSGCCRSPFLPRGCSCKQALQRGAREPLRQRRVGKGTPRCQQWRVQDGAEAHKSSARLQHPLWGRKDHPEASQPLPCGLVPIKVSLSHCAQKV